MAARFLNQVVAKDLGYCGGRLIREMHAPLIWANGFLRRETPIGFQTDLASVPRLPIIYAAWGDRVHREPIGHDQDYRTDSEILVIASEEINLRFKDCMIPEEYIVDRISPIPRKDGDWYFRITIKDRQHTNKDGELINTYSYFVYQPMYWAVRVGGGSSYHSKSMDYKYPIDCEAP